LISSLIDFLRDSSKLEILFSLFSYAPFKYKPNSFTLKNLSLLLSIALKIASESSRVIVPDRITLQTPSANSYKSTFPSLLMSKF